MDKGVKKIKNKAKPVNREVNRYLVAFMFIAVGIIAVGLTTYISSIIPNMVLTPTGVYTQNQNQNNTLGSPLLSFSANISGSNVAISFPSEVSPPSGQQLLVVVDITNISNPDPTDLYLNEYQTGASTGYFCYESFHWGQAYGGTFVWGYSATKVNKICNLVFSSSHTATVSVYVFGVSNTNLNATDIAPALGYSPIPKSSFSVSISLFINILGFATGIVFMITGVGKLGVKI